MGSKKTKEEFFNNLYHSTYYNLRKFVQKRSNNSFMVDDVLQEVYLEVFRHLDDLKTHENYIGWIYKTADNKILKLNDAYYRCMVHETALDAGLSEKAERDRETEFLALEQYRRLLQEDEYDFLMKKYKDGYSHKELAEMAGSSEAASKMKLSRILGKLKKKLKQNTPLFFLVILNFFCYLFSIFRNI